MKIQGECASCGLAIAKPKGRGGCWRALLSLAFFTSASMAAPRSFYVSTTGSDDHPGTRSKPFASLEKARQAVRILRQEEGGLPQGGITIYLRGGDYIRTNSFVLTQEDAGRADAPVVWTAYGRERVRLLGGLRLSGFKRIEDPAVLARLDPPARSQVLWLDLSPFAIAGKGEMQSRGFGRASAVAHPELFSGGRPMTLARWPNEGAWEKIAGFPQGSGEGDDHGGTIGALTEGYFYEGDRPRRWKDISNLWVHGYWAYDWANSYERVTSIDLDQRWLRTAAPHGLYGFRKGQRFHYLNVLEELDTPGEWFLDGNAGTLYFWPPHLLSTSETLLSLCDQSMLRLLETSHVTIRGWVLEAGRGHGVEIRGGTANRITGCRLRNLGNAGVVIEGGTSHGVMNCDIFDTGDGGVSMAGGDRQTLSAGAHFVENCHFQRQGRWSKCYVPAIGMSGVGLRASHNLIHDHPHCAILFGGNDHLIEFNDIHHIALETGDVGAIYAGRDYTFRGNRIRHNYIHETGGVGMGSMGVYMDDCVSGTEVYGNVFYRVHWAMFIGGGRDHQVINNLFVECDPAVRVDGRGLDRSPVWLNMVDRTMRDRLREVPLDLYRQRYPALMSLDRHYGAPGASAIRGDDFKGVPPEGNVIARNVCVGKWIDIGWHARKELFDFRDNVVTEHLETRGGAPASFHPAKASAAYQHGFETIPIARIGLRAHPDRRRLARMP